ncbi:hypothetical protein NQ317_019824 [Molorchus minor]|uniref:THAP-type domain-containing protein n=1 Tax=Molorchus minor TaxID=1323400 RepID=A0ABQ9J0V4_9CUCU|nr:hypothetical protein NQ317_019824 [Molorchus minor]
MNSSYYKYCIVPQCKSTTIKTPNKLFIYVPNNEQIRKKWLKFARKDDVHSLSTNSRMYFGADHFDCNVILPIPTIISRNNNVSNITLAVEGTLKCFVFSSPAADVHLFRRPANAIQLFPGIPCLFCAGWSIVRITLCINSGTARKLIRKAKIFTGGRSHVLSHINFSQRSPNENTLIAASPLGRGEYERHICNVNTSRIPFCYRRRSRAAINTVWPTRSASSCSVLAPALLSARSYGPKVLDS